MGLALQKVAGKAQTTAIPRAMARICSAAVMLSIFLAVACWIVVLFNRFY